MIIKLFFFSQNRQEEIGEQLESFVFGTTVEIIKDKYFFLHTVKFVTVVKSGYENVLFHFYFYQVHKQMFGGKCFTDDATATPPAAPSNGPHICGCLRCACGSASVICLESVITHKDKKANNNKNV